MKESRTYVECVEKRALKLVADVQKHRVGCLGPLVVDNLLNACVATIAPLRRVRAICTGRGELCGMVQLLFRMVRCSTAND